MEDLSRRIRLFQWCLDRVILLNDFSIAKFREDQYMFPPAYLHFIQLQKALADLMDEFQDIVSNMGVYIHRVPCALNLADVESAMNLLTRTTTTATAVTSMKSAATCLTRTITASLSNPTWRRVSLPITRVQLVNLGQMLEELNQSEAVNMFLLLSS